MIVIGHFSVRYASLSFLTFSLLWRLRFVSCLGLSAAHTRLLSQSERTVVKNLYNRQPEQSKDRSLPLLPKGGGGGTRCWKTTRPVPPNPCTWFGMPPGISQGVYGGSQNDKKPPLEKGTYVCIIWVLPYQSRACILYVLPFPRLRNHPALLSRTW
jgi:hypothetical protein